jgi:predicted DNA-binding transcriptional regulator AlpA
MSTNNDQTSEVITDPIFDNRFVTTRELRARYGYISGMTLWRWMRDPRVDFPKPVKLYANGRNYWWYPDILAYERRRPAHTAQPQAERSAVARAQTATIKTDAGE